MSSKNNELITTSVKVHKDLWKDFNEIKEKNNFNFQKLANRALDLYLKDEDFRRLLHNHIDLVNKGRI